MTQRSRQFRLFWLPLYLLLWQMPTIGVAQNIYIWEDDDGIQHLSDRKPDGDRVVTVQPALAEPEQPVRMDNIGRKGQPVWRFANRMHGPAPVEIVAPIARNMISEPALPAWIEIPARGVELLTLAPDDWERSWEYRLETAVVPGAVNPTYDPEYAYRMPLANEQSVVIGQAFNGEFSHQTPGSRFAIDLALPIGTPIHAARAGV
ncbi:MAG: hypothetical protein AAGH65_08855, partial [Pseudomonadota bacterium]